MFYSNSQIYHKKPFSHKRHDELDIYRLFLKGSYLKRTKGLRITLDLIIL